MSPLNIFVASSGLTPTGWWPSCAGDRRAGCRSVGEVSPEWNKGAESPPWACCPLIFGCIPGCGWLSEVVWGVQDRVLHHLGVGGGQAADCGNGKEQAKFSPCLYPCEANADDLAAGGRPGCILPERNPESKIWGKVWGNSFQKQGLELQDTSGSRFVVCFLWRCIRQFESSL